MSRLKDRLTEENIIQCELINKILQEKIYEIDKPEHMVLDLDSTNLSTYGKQEDSEYNYHYKARGYHPLMMFNGLNGDLLKVELRKGSCYTSNGVVKFVEDYLKMQSKEYVGVQKLIRGDSGFAVPELYELAEENDMFFCIRLKANAKLYKKVEWLSNEILEESKDENEYICRFDEFYYKADSWKKERKVVVKIEKIPNENALKYMFITTNMDMLAKDIVSVYCNRGKMENFIKECKNGFGFNKMSNRSFIANANKLQQLMLAYNLVNWFKRLCFSSKNKKMQIGTIRTKLFKIGARIVKSSRKSVIKMSSSYPYVNEFLSIMNKIECLQV